MKFGSVTDGHGNAITGGGGSTAITRPPIDGSHTHVYDFKEAATATQFENSVAGAAQPLVIKRPTQSWSFRGSTGGVTMCDTIADGLAGAWSANTAAIGVNWTMEIYCLMKDTSVGTVFFSIGSGDGFHAWNFYWSPGNNRLELDIHGVNTPVSTVFSGHLLPLYIAVTSDGTTAKFYVNGVAMGTSTAGVSGGVANPSQLILGNGSYGGNGWRNVFFGNVMISNVVRSAAYITAAAPQYTGIIV